MSKDTELAHELQRKKLWADAWVHTASAVNCYDCSTASLWADKALEAFDKRFPKPNKE